MSCISNALIKFNGKVEQFFYKLGGLISTYPLLSVTFTILFWGGFGFGLYKAKTENDIYKLWIEDNSRLINERAFDAEHFPFGTRSEFLIATAPVPGQSLMTAEVLSDWLAVSETLLDVKVNYTGNYGVFAGTQTYSWEDVCSRYNMPLQLRPVFSVSGNPDGAAGPWRDNYPRTRGFQCQRYTVLDCFQQGRFDFALYPPTINQFLQDRYNGTSYPIIPVNIPARPSFKGKSPEELMFITAPSCASYLGTSTPWNYLYGSVTRQNPADSLSNLTHVGSLQLVAQASTPKQFATVFKKEACVAKAELQQLALGANRPDPIGASKQPGNCAYDASYCLSWIGGAKYADSNDNNNKNVSNAFWQKDCYQQAQSCADEAVGLCAMACGSGSAATLNQCAGALVAILLNGANPMTTVPQCIIDASAFGAWQSLLNNANSTRCRAALFNCKNDVLACLGAGLACYANELAGCQDPPTNGEFEDAENIVKAWEIAYIDHMAAQKASNAYPSIVIDYYAERSTSDLVDAAGSADLALILLGYLLEFLFVGLTFWQYSQLESRILAGTCGLLLMCIGMISCLGLTVLSGIPLSPTIVQVLPFVGLGLGVDLLFVLGSTYKYRPGWTYAEMGGAMLAYSGPSISLSCITNFFAFLVGYFVPLPSVNQFAYAAMIGVAVNYFMVLIGFTAILTLDAKRIRANRVDFFCCFRASTRQEDIKPNEGNSTGIWRKFADVVLSLPAKIIISVMGVGLLIAGIIGAQTIDVGLPLADIVPKDHYAHEFLYQREVNYGAFIAGIDIGMDRNGNFIQYDYSDHQIQRLILDMERRFEYVYGYSATIPVRAVSALDQFLIFANSDNATRGFLNFNIPAYNLPNFNPNNYAVSSFPQMSLRFVLPNFFYQQLNNWLSLPGTGSALASAFEFDEDGIIKSLKLTFIQENLFNLPAIMEHIHQTRAITDTSGLGCFPAGFVYNLYEQYLNVRTYLSSHLGYVTIAVAICLCTFLYNPLAVLILLGSIVVITVEVYGFLHWFGLKLNGVSVVNIIMGVGVSVEFCAHIVRFFMVFTGTRQDRANQSLRIMAFPIINGMVTTLIGIFPMAFAKFPYFTLYFFYQYVIILVAGLFNGVFFLPVFLSLLGPPTLSATHDKQVAETG